MYFWTVAVDVAFFWNLLWNLEVDVASGAKSKPMQLNLKGSKHMATQRRACQDIHRGSVTHGPFNND